MKLTVLERLTLQSILPKEGNFVNLKVIRKLREALSFSEAEIQNLSFVYEFACPKCKQSIYTPVPVKCAACDVDMEQTGKIKWDDAKDPNKDVFMGKAAEKICEDALNKLNSDNKLTEQNMSLYEKFIAPEEVGE